MSIYFEKSLQNSKSCFIFVENKTEMTLSGNTESAARIAKIFSGANIIDVCVLANYIHIETFQKYEKFICESLEQAGISVLKVGVNFKGNFQISAKA